MIVKILNPQPKSLETAYIISSYPFGHRRCQMRVWMEENKKGFRVCKQTTKKHIVHDEPLPIMQNDSDLSNENWNKAKKSTYDNFSVLYLDEENHVKAIGIHDYSGLEDIKSFCRLLGLHGLDSDTQKNLEGWEKAVSLHENRKNKLQWKINV